MIPTKVSHARHPADPPYQPPPPEELEREASPSKQCPDRPVRLEDDFDWSQVTEELLRVCARDAEPVGAYLAVRHRGHWFYIQDDDHKSKSTFALLMQLFSLQSGEKTGLVPIITTH